MAERRLPGFASHDRAPDWDPQALTQVFTSLGHQLMSQTDTSSVLHALTEVAVTVVSGARWASVTQGRSEHFVTLAASAQVAADADALQYQLGTGPCIDAVIGEAVFDSPDLALDDRWSSFGPQAARDYGTRSVLSLRLMVDDDHDTNASLNLYSDHNHAFDESARHLAMLLATHAAVAISAVSYRETAQQLQQALHSNREIGVAMGVLMTSHQLTRQQAFDLLRMASQHLNRKLRDIATDVADTGQLTWRTPRDTRHST